MISGRNSARAWSNRAPEARPLAGLYSFPHSLKHVRHPPLILYLLDYMSMANKTSQEALGRKGMLGREISMVPQRAVGATWTPRPRSKRPRTLQLCEFASNFVPLATQPAARPTRIGLYQPSTPAPMLISRGDAGGAASGQMYYVGKYQQFTNINPPVRPHSSCIRPRGIMSTRGR